MIPRNSLIELFIVTSMLLIGPLGWGQSTTHKKIDLYSENTKAQSLSSEGIFSETRMRVFPLNSDRLHPYLGAYGNSYRQGPMIGVLGDLSSLFHLQVLAEQRWAPRAEWSEQFESRFGLIAGDWRPVSESFFIESYGESILIPRLAQRPVSTIWSRVFFREALRQSFEIHPFVQIWARQSPLDDLGSSGLEFRPGLRLLWSLEGVSIALLAYHREKIHPYEPSEFEGMLILSGEWQ